MAAFRDAVRLLPAANGEEAPLSSGNAQIVDEQELRDVYRLDAPVDCAFPACQNSHRVTYGAGHAVFACERCRVARYCSVECQVCAARAEREARRSALSSHRSAAV